MTREEKVNLLNELLKIEEKNDIGNLTSTNRREFQQWVEDLEQEPKTGHWIVDREYSRLNIRCKQTFNYSVHCDKCNYRCDYTTDVKGSLPSEYCPNCGAKIEGEYVE